MERKVLVDITEEEWQQYQWHHIGGGIYLRGVKYTQPPQDGYHYVEVTTFGDKEQKWIRARRYEEDK